MAEKKQTYAEVVAERDAYKLMMTMFSPEYVKMTAERTERIKGELPG